MAQQKNEGEGNQTQARAFDRDQKRFAESGKVEQAAREAEKSLDNTEEARHLKQAERVGKSHSHGEDPAQKR
jgi:hypothetical protein